VKHRLIDSLDLRRTPSKPLLLPAPSGVAPQKVVLGGTTMPVSSVGAGTKGPLSNWIVNRLTASAESRERRDMADRAEDLAANDPHAASALGGLTVNVSGTGFTPQSSPPADVLGMNPEQVRRFQRQCEWAWQVWSREADAAGRLDFWQIQYLSTWSFFSRGEFFRLPVMLPDGGGRTFSLALQGIDPIRVYTPSDKASDPVIRDGVALGPMGEAVSYYVENPKTRAASLRSGFLTSAEFSKIRARVGHRRGILHGYVPRAEDQVRGVTILGPAMPFFKSLSDYIDFELVGAIVAASTPMAVETTNPYAVTGGLSQMPGTDAKPRYYQELDPGQIAYLNPNETIKSLENSRPGDSFDPFVERILRAVGSSIGMPYEVVSRDYSKTNYSSARAALLEAWRVIQFYQKWMIHDLCQPSWEMVIEEAWLRGMIEIPGGCPDFYNAMPAYCNARWVPPKRGHVDPVKEIMALIKGYDAGFYTMADVVAELGGDWESMLLQRRREADFKRKEGIEDGPTGE